MRVNLLGACVVLVVALMTTLAGNDASASIAGLALSFASQLIYLLQWTMKTGIEVEANMV